MLTGSEDNILRVWELEWELAAVDGVAALTGQFKAPTAGSSASSPAIRLPRSGALQPAVNADAAPPAEHKPRLSVFINLKDKPKG
jgi:hypothetical protein